MNVKGNDSLDCFCKSPFLRENIVMCIVSKSQSRTSKNFLPQSMAVWQGPVRVHSASLYFSNNKYRSIDIMLGYTVWCVLER